jgi:hypothetical protein
MATARKTLPIAAGRHSETALIAAAPRPRSEDVAAAVAAAEPVQAAKAAPK